MGRFRVVKNFLFLILFLPVLVMGLNDNCTQFDTINVGDNITIRYNSSTNNDSPSLGSTTNDSINVIDIVKGDSLQDGIGSAIENSNIWIKIESNLLNANNNVAYINDYYIESPIGYFSDIYQHKYRYDIMKIMQDCIIDAPKNDTIKDDGTTRDFKFEPNKLINRAEFTKIVLLAKYLDTEIDNSTLEVSFSDVFTSDWFSKYIYFAATHPEDSTKKIIKGYDDGTFKPAQNINFAEASKIIVNTLLDGIPQKDETPWYKTYTNILIKSTKLQSFFTTNFEYHKNVTRGEMAFLINTVREALKKDVNPFVDPIVVPEPVVPNPVIPDPVVPDPVVPAEPAVVTREQHINNILTAISQENNSIIEGTVGIYDKGACKTYLNHKFYLEYIDNIEDINADITYNADVLASYSANMYTLNIDENHQYLYQVNSATYVASGDNENDREHIEHLLNLVQRGDILQMVWYPNSRAGSSTTQHTIVFNETYENIDITDNTILNWADSNSMRENRVNIGSTYLWGSDKTVDSFKNYLSNYCNEYSQTTCGATLYRLREQQ